MRSVAIFFPGRFRAITCDMFSKIYLAVLALAILIMAFFTYYSWSWLQSIGSPAAAVEGYAYHESLSWSALWLFAAILMVLGNAVLWTTKRAWALWATFLFFSVFAIIRYFWLDQAYFHFKKANGMFDGSFSIAPIMAVVLVVLMGIIVFFDTFLVTRLNAKTHPVAEEPPEPNVPKEPETESV